jgi:hypothetical protein
LASGTSERFVQLNRLGEEFADRLRRGDRPALQEYIDRHPELADEIREFFPAIVEMEQVRAAREELTGPPAAGPTPPLERLGDYRILREIGRGGMGVVYEAEQESLGRRVALKVLPPHLLADPQQVRRFEREARSAARLHHTHIVPVFGVGHQDGAHFYVMQLIDGQGLDAVLDELKRLRQDRAGEPGEPGCPARRRDAAAIAVSLATGRFAAGPDGEAAVGLGTTLPIGESTPDGSVPTRWHWSSTPGSVEREGPCRRTSARSCGPGGSRLAPPTPSL